VPRKWWGRAGREGRAGRFDITVRSRVSRVLADRKVKLRDQGLPLDRKYLFVIDGAKDPAMVSALGSLVLAADRGPFCRLDGHRDLWSLATILAGNSILPSREGSLR